MAPPRGSKAHVVAVPMPAQGHINPLMQLCKQLAERGITVSFLNSDLYHQRILKSQQLPAPDHHAQQAFVTLPSHHGLDIRLMGLGDGLHPDHLHQPPKIPDLLLAFLQNTIGPSFQDAAHCLIAKLVQQRDPPVTCIISDMRLVFTQDIANELGIPRVAFWTQNAANFAAHVVVTDGYRPPADDSTLITCFPGAPPHKRSELSELLTADPSHPLFHFGTNPYRRRGEAVWILLNTFDELEESAMAFLKKDHGTVSVGPLVTPPFFNNSATTQSKPSTILPDNGDSCLQWLNTRPKTSVLYVSFGTLVPLSPQQMIELAHGLEASGRAFLWVIRPDHVMPSESAGSLQEVLHRTEHRARVVQWAPQLHVLAHTSVGGFLTHCGWNSILESVMQGIPMLGWPTFVDQGLNARCITDGWRIGMNLEADESGWVTKEEVEKKVKALMDGDKRREMRERGRNLREAAHRAVAVGGSSSANFELFVNWLGEQVASLQQHDSVD